ncbi:MAG: hypothetical protein PHV00_06130 [Syntrophales bacterium]|jgi:hypothetical protein|nr:hypothetical protein [Syntrophales bacterium]
MAGELVYQGHKIRIEDRDEERLVPVSDIAAAIDYDSWQLNKIINSDPVLKVCAYHVSWQAQTPTGGTYEQMRICINKEGLTGLLVKLNTSRIKDPARREQVQAFQRWAIVTLREALEAGLSPTRPEPAHDAAIAAAITACVQAVQAQTVQMKQMAVLMSKAIKAVTALEREASLNKHDDDPLETFFSFRPQQLAHLSSDVREFLRLACEIDPDAATNLQFLYVVYENWSQANCRIPLGRNSFYDQIRRALAGYGEIFRNRTKLYVRGLKIRHQVRTPDYGGQP